MPLSAHDLVQLGDDIFNRYNTYPGEGERNHCRRLVEFALLHARKMEIDIKLDLTHLAAMLHDLGLMVPYRPGTNYLTRTVEIARKELEEADLAPKTWAILQDSLLYNHAVSPPHVLPPMSEAFRRAVFTEHTRGMRRYGVKRRDVNAVFRDIPWANFNTVLADFVWKTTFYEPKSIRSIFFPKV